MKLLYHLSIFFLTILLVPPAFSEVVTQIVPSVSITTGYTDNFHQTETNKDDEFSTIFGAGLSFGLIGKNANMFLNYYPDYTKHNEYSEYDGWRHDISLTGQYQVTQHTSFTFSERFVRDFNRTVRTNDWNDHDTNDLFAGVVHQFGEKNYVGLDYTYSFDIYDAPNIDEFKSHSPAALLSYWFTPRIGLDLNLAYQKVEYDISPDEPETWYGDIKLLRSMTRHFDIFISYAHSYTTQVLGDHITIYPSIGFNWQPTEDSGLSMGFGTLFSEYEYFGDSNEFFVEFDGYQNFDLTRKTRLSITGSSGYDPIDTRAASLGFRIYGEIGFLLSYKLTRKLTAELDGSYEISKYDEPLIDRKDKSLEFGAGLVWSPLQWLTLDLSYAFIDFDTDSNTREDYQENIGLFSITMMPSKGVKYPSVTPRAELESRVFGR